MKDDILPAASEMRFVSLPMHCLPRGSVLMYEHSRFLPKILEFLIFYLLHAFCEHTFSQCNLWSSKFSSAFSTMHSKVSFTSSKGKNRSPNNLTTHFWVLVSILFVCQTQRRYISGTVMMKSENKHLFACACGKSHQIAFLFAISKSIVYNKGLRSRFLSHVNTSTFSYMC